MSWRVVRVLRIPVLDERYESAAEASLAAYRLSQASGGRDSYAICDESFPIDDVSQWPSKRPSEWTDAERAHVKSMLKG